MINSNCAFHLMRNALKMALTGPEPKMGGGGEFTYDFGMGPPWSCKLFVLGPSPAWGRGFPLVPLGHLPCSPEGRNRKQALAAE